MAAPILLLRSRLVGPGPPGAVLGVHPARPAHPVVLWATSRTTPPRGCGPTYPVAGHHLAGTGPAPTPPRCLKLSFVASSVPAWSSSSSIRRGIRFRLEGSTVVTGQFAKNLSTVAFSPLLSFSSSTSRRRLNLILVPGLIVLLVLTGRPPRGSSPSLLVTATYVSRSVIARLGPRRSKPALLPSHPDRGRRPRSGAPHRRLVGPGRSGQGLDPQPAHRDLVSVLGSNQERAPARPWRVHVPRHRVRLPRDPVRRRPVPELSAAASAQRTPRPVGTARPGRRRGVRRSHGARAHHLGRAALAGSQAARTAFLGLVFILAFGATEPTYLGASLLPSSP